MTDAEVFNFFKSQLLFNEDPKTKSDKSDFLFDDKYMINRICWMGPYLQKAGDWKYFWLAENMNDGIHHPLFDILYIKFYKYSIVNVIFCFLFY